MGAAVGNPQSAVCEAASALDVNLDAATEVEFPLARIRKAVRDQYESAGEQEGRDRHT